jgi:ParB family chromosome partitioning protein
MRKKYVVEDIDLDKIDVDAQLIRESATDDDIGELAESIAAVDILQFPGVVRGDPGRYTLAWGRRRLEALKRLGEKTAPCRIYEGKVEDVRMLALIENNQRRQNSIKEECACVNYLVSERNLSPDQVAASLGRTRSWILTRLAIPNFPADCREALLSGTIPLGHAEEIAVLEDDGQRSYILNQTIYQKLPLSEVRQLVRVAQASPNLSEAVARGVEEAQSQVGYSPVMMACAKCGQPAMLPDLTIVRIHREGCPAAAQTPTEQGYPTTQEQ